MSSGAELRNRIDGRFTSFANLFSASRRPLPDQTGDGTYLNLRDDSPDLIARIEASLGDLSKLGITDIGTLMEVVDKKKNKQPWNDKLYLMERLVQTAVKFPDGSALGKKVTDGFLTTLYNDLQHPPISYLSDQYAYRSADGSCNSLIHKDLGKANTPYARTVAPKQMQPGALPDPGIIFDSIMARKDKNRTEHPNKISSMLFYLASIIIHDLFRTDHENFSNSKTSSYLDLAPLYGSNLEEQLAMRTLQDGKLKPDCFSESRLLSFPPGVGCILVMFNRFHNRVVSNIARINQGGRFTKPKVAPKVPPTDQKYPAEWKKYDEDLFQTGRLITSGLYINIILIDYVRTILNLHKTDSNWALDPRANIPEVPVAAGNQVSAEFNLVYRWHSTISPRDEKWTEMLFKSQFKDLDPAKVSWHDFVVAASKREAELQATPPDKRPLGPFKRTETGYFKDEDLVKELTDSIDDCANSYGANRVPTVMRVVEILGIMQARAWDLASLNEFRNYFGLTPHKTFEDINPDPEVATALKHLYDHPDHVEMYPGLVAEDAKKVMVPGAGLTPSFTVSRAVLSDAVALVRGDRFYTIDYHPKKLTNWGYTEVASDVQIDNGCVFYKLFLSAFPRHFKPNSIYAHYPLTVTREMDRVMKDLKKHSQYDWTKPGPQPKITVMSSYKAIKSTLSNHDAIRATTEEAMVNLLGPEAKSMDIVGTDPSSPASRKLIEQALYPDGKWEHEVCKYYISLTERMLKEKAYKLGSLNQVDMIRDIGNLVHIHFVSDMFCLPLKTSARPAGVFTEHELYVMLLSIFSTVYFDIDPVNTFPLRQKACTAVHLLAELLEENVEKVSSTGILSKLISSAFPDNFDHQLKAYGINLIKRLLAGDASAKKSPKHLVWAHILPTIGSLAATQSHLFAQTLAWLVTTPEGQKVWPKIHAFAIDESETAWADLQSHVLEASRLAGETGLLRSVIKDVEIPGAGKFAKGDRILLNLSAASRDKDAFGPDPSTFSPGRPAEAYVHLGMGPTDGIAKTALTAMFKVVGKLKNLSRAPGPQGVLSCVEAPFPGEQRPEGMAWYHVYLAEDWDRLVGLPQNLKVNWD